MDQPALVVKSNVKEFLSDVFNLFKNTSLELQVKENVFKKDGENNVDVTLQSEDNTTTNITISNQGKIGIKHVIK